jgi:Sulfotransferase family
MSIVGQMNTFPMIVGCNRSGTTLLRAMFDSHPEIAVPGESGFIVTMGTRRHRRRYEGPRGFRTDRFVADALDHPRVRQWNLPAEAADAFVAPRVLSFAEAVRRLYGVYAAAHGKPRYGDKTPGYVLHLPLLARLFPEARFIHLIRDGRDVALSKVSTYPNWGPKTVEDVALFWKQRVSAGRVAGARLGPSRYREVHYERLVEEPEATLRSLCDFVDVKFDGSMLQYFERAPSVLEAEFHPEYHQSLASPPKKGLRDWRRDMPDDHVTAFESLAGDLLEELGYERSRSSFPLKTRVSAKWRSVAAKGERISSMSKLMRKKLARQHQ